MSSGNQIQTSLAELEVFSNNPYKFNYRTESGFPKIIDVRSDDLNKDGRIDTSEHYVKAFLLDDSVNKNFWNIPQSSMKRYASSFIGRPLISHPSGSHPDYLREGMDMSEGNFVRNVLEFQKQWQVGEIVDVRYEPVRLKSGELSSDQKAWFAYIRMNQPEFTSRLKSGDVSFYVSPQVYDIHQNPVPGVTSEFIPIHLAVVRQPAYGEIAAIKGVCNGNGVKCIKALKSAATELLEQIGNYNHSSFFENLAQNNYKLSYNQNNPPLDNYPPTNGNGFNQPANVGYDPNSQYNSGNNNQQQGQNFVNTKNVSETTDSQGNKHKKIEESKKAAGNNTVPSAPTNPSPQQVMDKISASAPQTQSNNQGQTGTQGNPNPDINTSPPSSYNQSTNPNPQATNNPQGYEIPEDVKNAMRVVTEFQQKFQGIEKETEENRKFREQYKQEQMKKAAEEQRSMIESAFTDAVIQDPAAREDIINKFVSLPLTDEQMKFILDLVVSGGFQSAAVDGNGKKQVKSVRIKSASVQQNDAFQNQYDMIMSNPDKPNPYYGPGAINSQFRKSFFGSNIDYEALLKA